MIWAGAPAYCPYYCEENVWQLCADPRVGTSERKVLVISNALRRVAMWGQRVSTDPSLPITWDYHVVLLAHRPRLAWDVWDLDGDGPCPRPFADWLEHSFHSIGLLPPELAPRFRMIDCADYRRHLRSDRRHMRNVDGTAKQPEPPWPAIVGEPVVGYADDGSNLDRFLDTTDAAFLGRVFDLPQLRAWLRERDPVARA
jgi:hypothetical protein